MSKPTAGESARRIPGTEYSFVFDKAKDARICSVHGEVDFVGWVPCWNGCDDGYFGELYGNYIHEYS